MTLRPLHSAAFLANAPVARLFRDAEPMEVGTCTSETGRVLVGRKRVGTMG